MPAHPNKKNTGSLSDYGEVHLPTDAEEPILSRPVRGALAEWLEEHWSQDELAEVGLKPRRRAIFDGPPGSGKTTLAHHLAARIGLPMVAVRSDLVLASYVSASANAVGHLFELAKAEETPCILFFDEFDTIAQKRMRSGQNELGESDHNATVNTLLQRLEAHDGFIIAATNEAKAIDPAVWRRFDIHIHVDLPGQFERERIIERYLSPYLLEGDPLKRLGEALGTASPSLIRQFCEALKRNIVIGPKAEWNMQKEAVIERIITAVEPHPEAGKPRLWSQGAKDIAVRWLPWPLPRMQASAPAEKADAA